MALLARQSDRWWSLVLMSLTLPAGIAPFVDRGAFDTPVFAVIKDIAPVKVWGAVWLLASLFAVGAATSGRWVYYVIGNALTLGLCTAWIGAVCWAKFIDGERLTTTAIGLWLFAGTACLHAILTPTPVAAMPRPEGGGDVVSGY